MDDEVVVVQEKTVETIADVNVVVGVGMVGHLYVGPVK